MTIEAIEVLLAADMVRERKFESGLGLVAPSTDEEREVYVSAGMLGSKSRMIPVINGGLIDSTISNNIIRGICEARSYDKTFEFHALTQKAAVQLFNALAIAPAIEDGFAEERSLRSGQA